MTEGTERGMTMDDLDILPNEYLPQQGERAEYCGKCRASIHNPMWQMVDFEPVGQISDPRPRRCAISVCYNDDIMASVDKLLLRI